MQPQIAVRVQAATLPKAGVAATLRFSGETLIVEGPELSLRAESAQVNVHVGGFDDDQLFLHWHDGQTSWSVTPIDKASHQALLAQSPSALLPHLRKGQFKAKAQRFKWNTVLTTLALFVLAIVLGIWQLDRVERWLAAQIPLSTEKRLGEATLKSLKNDDELDQTSVAAKAVSEIGGRLTKGSRYEYHWFVKEDDSINAFAMPGGVVIVHSGLIANADSPEQLAAVLAHEVQHVEQRHILQQMIHSAGLATVLALTMGDVSAIASVLLHSAGSMRHSRELEAQADAGGVKALVAAGIQPKGMAEFFSKLMAKEKEKGADKNPAILSFLSSHPATDERLAAMQVEIKANPCDCQAIKMDWAAVKGSLKKSEARPVKQGKSS
ncbi:M48 family metallopeptidase [Stenotrophobium rhamnosiphilum]|uniref:Peptidase M48 domain-containing protein n=1 Tax=Stenotrophobium rhamnosiphilum TaxID=2029166 RepID=A0A2T5MKP0_9GAMM|nr:M48 family metallopeptidase [Stenotrophobium rhamnosiphilum]PTU33153.1 hypothetical protein CJD38_03365 [Stenotrophobium rhamnosiphilum]